MYILYCILGISNLEFGATIRPAVQIGDFD
jgi:hypothetical protein